MNKPQHDLESAIDDDFNKIKTSLIQQFKMLMLVLEKDQLPDPDDCIRARQLLRKYEELKNALEKVDDNGLPSKITFRDSVVTGISARDIVKDITADPEYLTILHKLALIKVLPTSRCNFSKGKIEFLLEKEYVVQYYITVKDSEIFCLSLSAKGWLCFTRKTVVEQLNKRLGKRMLYVPADLCFSVNEWEDDNYLKALILSKYHWNETERTDLLVFSYPENKKFLLGCVPSDSGFFEYSVPVINTESLSKEDISVLKKIISDNSISKLTLLFSNLKDKQAAETIIDPINRKNGKVVCYIMENDNE